ncbi:basic salivary proline-rich protein 2-like [Onychomys torridus]|uniref:basic salivary proline-rich protein 2-like n=1 Tax=Onychomys torridus TaxID=38674 RepID=UPI00167FC8E5|nr:basic salivary proline-rich protein 2-like [Onychomys torridus]
MNFVGKIKGSLLGSRSKVLHRPHVTLEFEKIKNESPPSARAGPGALGVAFLPSPARSAAPGKLPAPPTGSGRGAAKPRNGPPGAARRRRRRGGPRRPGQGHPQFVTRRSRPAPPPGALLGPAPPPPQGRLGLPRPARPGPVAPVPAPARPRSPESLAEAASRRLEPHGPPPAPGQTRVSPAVVGRALARAGSQRACALPPPRRAPWARAKKRQWTAAREPRGGERQNPERIRSRDLAGPWVVPKGAGNSEAETSSLCVLGRKSERREEDRQPKCSWSPPQSVLCPFDH